MDGVSDLSPTGDPFSFPASAALVRLCPQCQLHYQPLSQALGSAQWQCHTPRDHQAYSDALEPS